MQLGLGRVCRPPSKTYRGAFQNLFQSVCEVIQNPLPRHPGPRRSTSTPVCSSSRRPVTARQQQQQQQRGGWLSPSQSRGPRAGHGRGTAAFTTSLSPRGSPESGCVPGAELPRLAAGAAAATPPAPLDEDDSAAPSTLSLLGPLSPA